MSGDPSPGRGRDGAIAGSAWPALELGTEVVDGLAALCRAAVAVLAPQRGPETLRLSVRGLSTGPVAVDAGGRLVEVTLDLRDHWLTVETSEGAVRPVALRDGVVPAEVLGQVVAALAEVGVDVGAGAVGEAGLGAVGARPVAYDPDVATRWWEALRRVDAALESPELAMVEDRPGVLRPDSLTFVRPIGVSSGGGAQLGLAVSGDRAAGPGDGGGLPTEGRGSGLFARSEVDLPPDAVDAPLAPAAAVWLVEGFAWLPYDALCASPDPTGAAEAFWQSAVAGFESAVA